MRNAWSVCLAVVLTFPCAGCKLLEPDDEADAGDAGGAGNEDGDTAQIADPLTREGGAVVGVVEGTTGVPIAGVQVTSGALRTVTDSQGRYALSAVSPTKAMVIRYGGDGYSHTFRSIEVVEGVVTTADAVLLTEPSPHRIEKAEEGGTLVEGGITLTIPPDAIVDALGEQVTGPIDVTITPIDPSTPQMAAAPSDFKATAIDGTADVLISYMMAQITVRRGTAELNVAPGKFVGIEMVLPLVFTESADGEPVAGFNEQERLRAGDRVPL